MKIPKFTLLIILFVFTLGCNEDNDVDIKRLDETTIFVPEATATDLWIKNNLTDPYNIEVIYRWEDIQNNYGKNLVPPQEEYIIDFLTTLKKLFIEVYVEEAGADFFKDLVPKQFVLVGSESYNNDGTVTQGTAEGGRKIVLYGVNDFKNPQKLRRFIHVMHHEFGHIMHQTKFYDEEYQQITKSSYTSTWANYSLEEALNRGCISPYAQLNSDEDFVEMLAFYVTLSEKQWDERLSIISKDKALESILKKEQILRSYLKIQWGIDLDKFRDNLNAKIENEIANL